MLSLEGVGLVAVLEEEDFRTRGCAGVAGLNADLRLLVVFLGQNVDLSLFFFELRKSQLLVGESSLVGSLDEYDLKKETEFRGRLWTFFEVSMLRRAS